MIVVVEAGGKLYSANKEVKVTVGGAGLTGNAVIRTRGTRFSDEIVS